MSECVICDEKTEYQKFLSCGGEEKHKMCQICIQKLVKPVNGIVGNCEKVVDCPLCRKPTLLPNGEASKLQTKFFVELICENCSKTKNIEDQWWCANCELTICGTCAMIRHREHDCRRWEEYDVPKEFLSFLKSRMQNKDINGYEREVKVFCQQLESKLLENFKPRQNYSELIDSLEACFGNLTMAKTEKQNITNFEKKAKVIVELMKSTKISSGFNFDGIQESFNEEKEMFMNFPSLDEVFQLFQNGQLNSISSQPGIDVSSVNAMSTSQSLKEKLLFEKIYQFINFSDLKMIFAVADNDEDIFCTDGLKLHYLKLQPLVGNVRLVQSISLWSPDDEANESLVKCSSQIVYHRTRNSVFVTKQINDENRLGSLLEFSAANLNLSHSSKLPVNKKIKTNGTYLLGVLSNGRIVLVVSDDVKVLIYFKHVKSINTDQYDCVFENVESSNIMPNIPLEPLHQLAIHFIDGIGEVIIVSGTFSIFCFTMNGKVEFYKQIKNVLKSRLSFYCFSNHSNIFIYHFGDGKFWKIDLELWMTFWKIDWEALSVSMGVESVYHFKGIPLTGDVLCASNKNSVYLYAPSRHILIKYKIC